MAMPTVYVVTIQSYHCPRERQLAIRGMDGNDAIRRAAHRLGESMADVVRATAYSDWDRCIVAATHGTRFATT